METVGIGFGTIVALIAVALAFDFMNGFHDAANSIATIVSTRVLRPHYAVAWAAFFNFVAFLFFGLNVANTIGKGVIEPALVDHYVIFGALIIVTLHLRLRGRRVERVEEELGLEGAIDAEAAAAASGE